MKDLAILENERKRVDEDINEIESRVRKENPRLKKFKNVAMVSCGFLIGTISDIFKKDIIFGVQDLDDLYEDDSNSQHSFKIFKKDFAFVYTSFPYWYKVGLLFYNNEEDIKEQFTDLVYAKTIYDPGVYELTKNCGRYGLQETEVIEEEAPELDDDIFSEIQNDITQFFGNRKFYRDNKLSYKRGILMYGPPGNGKSATIKQILMNNPDKIGIIINQELIETSLGIFLAKATKDVGKILIIEDIDSVPDYKRSDLLNLLDGVGGLEDSFIIATTNYLSKLDPAICNRPSRFDKTYHFGIPKKETRKRIITKYFGKMGDKKLGLAVTETDKFSGAYIKELFIQCGTQKIDILEAIEQTKQRTKDYQDYKEPTYYG